MSSTEASGASHRNRFNPVFLCSSCLTEQYIREIDYQGLKVCLCPNCKQVCCQDYCCFDGSGRWNGTDWTVDIDMPAYKREQIRKVYEAEYKATKTAYEQAHKQLNMLIELRNKTANHP